jgi:hypothetical protein
MPSARSFAPYGVEPPATAKATIHCLTYVSSCDWPASPTRRSMSTRLIAVVAHRPLPAFSSADPQHHSNTLLDAAMVLRNQVIEILHHIRRASMALAPADRLSCAGVPIELHVYPRAYHGFYRATNARVTKQAEHDTREALRRLLHG